MPRILATLEIIIDTDGLLKSEIETAIHNMMRDSKETQLNVYDYGLDLEYVD